MNNVRRALDNLPFYRASRAEWRRRGFRVKYGRVPIEKIAIWNGMFYNNIKIYDIEQCEEIRGVKAALRREMWLSRKETFK